MSRYRRHVSEPPRFLNARYAGTCAETGKAIAVGDEILYYPSSRKVYCKDSQTYKDFQTAEFDRIYLGREY
jgi:hypothetical protein